MAMNKKKSRAINVNGIPYRYSVRTFSQNNEDWSFNLNIIVQLASGEGCYLKVDGVYTRDFWLDISSHIHDSSEYFTVRPKHIAKLIELALKEGWQPETNSGPYHFKADNGFLRNL